MLKLGGMHAVSEALVGVGIDNRKRSRVMRLKRML